mgnify:FL=1
MGNEAKEQGDVTTQQGTVTEEQKTGQQESRQGKDEKTFTTEEVNEIVQRRLAREREKLSKAFQEGTKESDLEERERRILKRELRADVLETLAENRMPAGLADLVNYDSKEDCEKSLKVVSTVFNQAVNEAVRGKARQSTPIESATHYMKGDPLAKAFNIKR